MDSLSQKINEILGDPDRMHKIMELASAMELSRTVPAENKSPISEELLSNLSEVMHRAEEKNTRQDALLHALLPYLKPKRQQRLEQALELSRISILASAAFRSTTPSHSPIEEASNV